ncbi:hypothetical protein [Mesobacillus foraminis]|uniref:Uncharacterized protein n=1 Tax=Mesobacillus foraminis TaxID=279826 RepID=A0A4R2BJY6_9BACI|nr:hypothetical protein [Mesobacillus foraminis]TCN27306.1 hypothetical protein EV146_102255 [Mesobacillus foraminis]
MGTGTILVSVVLFIYLSKIYNSKPFNSKKRKMLYSFVLFTFGLSIVVTFQGNFGSLIHWMNLTIGAMVKMVVK